jgi:uncharacterized protein (TIGR00251 family)
MRYRIKVIPNAKSDEVVEKGGIIVVRVKEKPEKGKATLKAIALLADYFKKPVRLVKGELSREKIVDVG